MKVIAIAAIGLDREIGKDNDLVWKIPEDLKRFMLTTIQSPIIMGRGTYESIGKPLPYRPNIVISKTMPKTKGIFVVRGIDRALEMAASHYCEKCFIIGGGKIYSQYIKQGLVDELLLTQIEGRAENPTVFFPEFEHLYKKVSDLPQETLDGLKYSFTRWIKK